MAKQANNNGANLGFEDKLRGNMEPSDYKHVALGLIFLKYISDAFEAKRAALVGEELADAEDPEEYPAENVFWVPKKARWPHLQTRARQTTIGKDIRRALVKADAVDCMIALPGQLFYSAPIPACLWFLARNKNPGEGRRDRCGDVLFIDARKLGHMVDRTRKEFSDEDIARIAETYHSWRGATDAAAYEDEPGFCKSVTLEETGEHDYVLTPGRYVGAARRGARATANPSRTR